MDSNHGQKAATISIIGRPNVGKSTIFNRILGRGEQAITHDRPGVTRDRHYAIASLDEVADHSPADIILVDTGGFYPEQIDEHNSRTVEEERSNHFFNIMTDHAKLAIDQSDLVLLVVDVREGLLPFDHSIARFLREGRRPFWVLINKFDTEKQRGDEAEFYALGVDDQQLFTLSAAHNRGIEDLKRQIQLFVIEWSKAAYPKESDLPKHQQWTRGLTANQQVISKLAIIGAPNAGKSTLLNRLLGVERALISDIPGTTIDPIQGFFDLYFGPEMIEEMERYNREREQKRNMRELGQELELGQEQEQER
ncbi:MAG: GTP-binding protein, partial [Bdellovibrionales bacterium]|nr:GTP-binding protein [Bdellovibrionales bacterium]